MVSAGVVELHRKETNATWINHINNLNITAKDVSIFLQVPQYGLMGISEIFVLITGTVIGITSFHFTRLPNMKYRCAFIILGINIGCVYTG